MICKVKNKSIWHLFDKTFITLNQLFYIRFILIFWNKVMAQNRTNKNNHIQHIWVSLDKTFDLKQTNLIFWSELALSGYLRSKTEKRNMTIKFNIYNLIMMPTFIVNSSFWSFVPNLPEKAICSPKQNKWTSPQNSAYPN